MSFPFYSVPHEIIDSGKVNLIEMKWSYLCAHSPLPSPYPWPGEATTFSSTGCRIAKGMTKRPSNTRFPEVTTCTTRCVLTYVVHCSELSRSRRSLPCRGTTKLKRHSSTAPSGGTGWNTKTSHPLQKWLMITSRTTPRFRCGATA